MVIQKKGLSPVVATVLLVMIVITLATIVLLWSRGFIEEAVTKDVGDSHKRVDEFCKEVKITPIINDKDLSGGTLSSFGFSNTGNVPIYGFNVLLAELNTGNTKVKEFINDQEYSVGSGFSIHIKDYDDSEGDGNGFLNYENYESIVIIPILLGKTATNTVAFTCPEENGLKIK